MLPDWFPLVLVGVLLLVIILFSVYPYFFSRSDTVWAAAGKTILWLALMLGTGYVVFSKTNRPGAGWFWATMLTIWLVVFLGFILYATANYYVAGVKETRSAGARKAPFPFRKVLIGLMLVLAMLVLAGLLSGAIGWTEAGRFLAFLGGTSFITAISRRFEAQREGGEGEAPELPEDGVLFIRAFRTEKEPFWSGWFTQAPVPVLPEHDQALVVSFTFEEFFQDAVQAQLGPLVGLGNPRDNLPSGSAGIVYGEDGVWQQSIQRLMASSKAILMKVGQSDNLRWELQQIIEQGAAQRFFIFTEPPQSPGVRRWNRGFCRILGIRLSNTDWNVFAAGMQTLGYQLPEHDPGPGAVIGFGKDLNGHVICTGADSPEAYLQAVGSA